MKRKVITLPALAAVIAIGFAAYLIVSDLTSGSDWERTLKEDPELLAYVPNRVPDGALIIGAGGDGLGGQLQSRELNFLVPSSSEFVEICFASSEAAVLDGCPGVSLIGTINRDVALPYVGVRVDPASEARRWLAGFDDEAPSVDDIEYFP